MTDDTIQQFIDADLAKKEFDRTKLHCTILNSKFMADPTTGKRKQFNAADFMRDETFHLFNFGRVTIDRKSCNNDFAKKKNILFKLLKVWS